MSPLILIVLCVTYLLSLTSAEKLSAYDVLRSYDFPIGLLPEGVTGYELDPKTGKFAAYLKESCSFSIQGYQLKYKSPITGYISKDRLTKLKGVTVKILFIWVNIVEVTNSDHDLDFSVGIASADFPIDNFDESPKCGCGFDCNSSVRDSRFNPFALSS
ncbi:hypothetical protein ACHQM5_015220 [Ranunculus cassubicifolius]